MVSWETYTFPIYFFAYSSEKNLQKKMLFFAIEVYTFNTPSDVSWHAL